MNVAWQHTEWTLVNQQAFEEFLKDCPDYVRDGWADGTIYKFRHNGEAFAFISIAGNIFVDPKFLT